MKEYNGALAEADEAAVFFSKHALELKRMPMLDNEAVTNGFKKDGLQVFSSRAELEAWLSHLNYHNSVTVFMSSGTYDGLNIEALVKNITSQTV